MFKKEQANFFHFFAFKMWIYFITFIAEKIYHLYAFTLPSLFLLNLI